MLRACVRAYGRACVHGAVIATVSVRAAVCVCMWAVRVRVVMGCPLLHCIVCRPSCACMHPSGWRRPYALHALGAAAAVARRPSVRACVVVCMCGCILGAHVCGCGAHWGREREAWPADGALLLLPLLLLRAQAAGGGWVVALGVGPLGRRLGCASPECGVYSTCGVVVDRPNMDRLLI